MPNFGIVDQIYLGGDRDDGDGGDDCGDCRDAKYCVSTFLIGPKARNRKTTSKQKKPAANYYFQHSDRL
ncbi:MAG: hypothetical protein WCS73_11365 [Lentisphaeria bacterium]